MRKVLTTRFNKSHAACYALIAYRTAWLRANHPSEYMAALISSVMSTKDKVPFFVARCEEMGIAILPPDVNLSDHQFTVVSGDIRFGLDAVKGVGHQAVEAIKNAREAGGPFESLWDFCARVDSRAVNKKAIEALIKCGAFGSTGHSRRGMLAVLEQAQGAGQKSQQDALIGQGSIFDLGDTPANGNGDGAPASPFLAPSHPPIDPVEFDKADLLAIEKEAIGLFISAHPLKEVRPALRERVDCPLSEVTVRPDGANVTVGGIITVAKKVKTKSGTTMMFATLDDLEGSLELIVFEGVLNDHESLLAVDQVVLVRGRVDHKDDTTYVIVQGVEKFEPSPEEVERARRKSSGVAPPPLRVCLDAGRLAATVIDELKHLLETFPGDSEVVLEMRTSSGSRTLKLGASYRVAPGAGLHAELSALLGEAVLSAG